MCTLYKVDHNHSSLVSEAKSTVEDARVVFSQSRVHALPSELEPGDSLNTSVPFRVRRARSCMVDSSPSVAERCGIDGSGLSKERTPYYLLESSLQLCSWNADIPRRL